MWSDVVYSVPCATLLNSCCLCWAVMVSQLCSRLAMTSACWTLEAFTHRRPFIPTTSSQGNSFCRSAMTSLWGASNLRGDGVNQMI